MTPINTIMAPPGPANGRDPSPKPPPNLNKATGYTQRTADLSTFAGQTVTLTFTATEDASLQTSFVVDDTAVTLS